MIIRSEILLNVECTPPYQIDNIQKFIEKYNGMIKVELQNFIGVGDDINYVHVDVRTNVQSQEVAK